MNLVAKIKRLELEAAEIAKRIEALEFMVLRVKPPATPPADPLHDVSGVGAAIAAKKRKPRAKTYGTE